jgi:predicted CXXCH cytochrome family protein
VKTEATLNSPGQRAKPGAKRRFLWVIGVGALIGLFVSCSSLQRAVIAPPTIPGATFVGNGQCELCHEDTVKEFAFSPHARLHVPGMDDGSSGCEACHGPGSKHVDEGGGKGVFIVNAGKHPEACLNCHLEKQAEFSMPFRHPVMEGKMSCSSCHDPHGGDIMKPAGQALARVNDTCMSCHREQSATHVFEHEALREGCVTCHAVHGSTNKKMLVENNNNLCLKCHAQLQTADGTIEIGDSGGHSSRTNVGTCWSSGCHDAVHGSNMNSHLRY